MERKEELEARKKRVISLKRQAKRAATTADDSTSGINVSAEQEVEMDLDLATEMEAIKSHLEQLRRYRNCHSLPYLLSMI